MKFCNNIPVWTFANNDSDWSLKVKNRYDGRCAWPACGSTWECQAHHVIRRGELRSRLIIEGGVYLCGEHHSLVERISKKKHLYKRIMQLLIGKETFYYLEEYSQNENSSFTIREMPSNNKLENF